jgi:hypothetical protein
MPLTCPRIPPNIDPALIPERGGERDLAAVGDMACRAGRWDGLDVARHVKCPASAAGLSDKIAGQVARVACCRGRRGDGHVTCMAAQPPDADPGSVHTHRGLDISIWIKEGQA